VHGLERPDRFLLEAACLLHDVGLSEGAEGHHRASRRLIMGLDVPLDERERRMVAAVARYHRGRLPRPGDRALEGLSPPDRDRVLRLAALLRVADGLDYGHAGAVKGLRAAVEGDAAVLTVEADERPEAEIAAARRKSDLFEEVFALPVVVR
jgi:exopolyphosphatase/guanosine-5'-triphosphate,3'-diphosphate pyrophosphatase